MSIFVIELKKLCYLKKLLPFNCFGISIISYFFQFNTLKNKHEDYAVLGDAFSCFGGNLSH